MSTTRETTVRKAAEFLDKYADGEISWLSKGWRDKIDLGILEMGSCVYCVLGQLQGGSYESAVNDLANESGHSDWDDVSDAFSDYRAEWTAYIAATRGNEGIDVTATWHEKGSTARVKDLKVIKLNDKSYVAFLRSSGNTALYTVPDFLAYYESVAPCPFKAGDVLEDQDGTFYLFTSEQSVIRGKDMGWQSYRNWVATAYGNDDKSAGRVFKKNPYRSADGSPRWSSVTFTK